MAVHYKYTDTEIKNILKTMTIVYDTREQSNQHILDYFKSKKINHVEKKLDFSDYSCYVPQNNELGFSRDTYFDCYIERKNSIEELSGNIGDNRDRFESELLRAKGFRILLMIEDPGGLDRIIEHKYNSEYGEKAFLASIFTFGHRYNIDVHFINKKYAGLFIHSQLYYYVREYLKSEAI